MERTKDVDDLKDHLAKAVARAHCLYECSLALMDRATQQLDQSAVLLWHRREVLRSTRLRLLSSRSPSPPNRS